MVQRKQQQQPRRKNNQQRRRRPGVSKQINVNQLKSILGSRPVRRQRARPNSFAAQTFNRQISNRRIVTNVEPIFDINLTSSQVNQERINSYNINPGNSALFPWLSSVAQSYKRYKFHRLSFMFKTSTNQTRDGQLVLAYAPDYEYPPGNMLQAKTLHHSQTPVYRSNNLSVNNTFLTREKYYYNRLGTDDVDEDLQRKFYDIGVLYMFYRVATAGDIGTLYVSYSIEFYDPISNVQAIAMANKEGISAPQRMTSNSPSVWMTNLLTLMQRSDTWYDVGEKDNASILSDLPYTISILNISTTQHRYLVTIDEPIAGRFDISLVVRNNGSSAGEILLAPLDFESYTQPPTFVLFGKGPADTGTAAESGMSSFHRFVRTAAWGKFSKGVKFIIQFDAVASGAIDGIYNYYDMEPSTGQKQTTAITFSPFNFKVGYNQSQA